MIFQMNSVRMLIFVAIVIRNAQRRTRQYNVICAIRGSTHLAKGWIRSSIKLLTQLTSTVENVMYYCKFNKCETRSKQLIFNSVNKALFQPDGSESDLDVTEPLVSEQNAIKKEISDLSAKVNTLCSVNESLQKEIKSTTSSVLHPNQPQLHWVSLTKFLIETVVRTIWYCIIVLKELIYQLIKNRLLLFVKQLLTSVWELIKFFNSAGDLKESTGRYFSNWLQKVINMLSSLKPLP